jgi:hypothetical protein
MGNQSPFADVRIVAGGFSIPELKWRELLFIGALKRDGEDYVLDPSRPLPPFERDGLFPAGARFRVTTVSGRVVVEQI